MAFADVVALTVAYLTPIMAPVAVASRVPDPRPVEFVQVRRVNSRPLRPVRELVDLDVFTWAADEPRATELGLDARSALYLLSGSTTLGVTVYDVDERKGLSMLDDPDTGTPRSWATYILAVRANEILHAT